jgi:flavodoxin
MPTLFQLRQKNNIYDSGCTKFAGLTIINTFLEAYDFSGKTIIPFNTHMGSGDGGTYKTIRELEPNAKVLEGLPVEMNAAEKGPEQAVGRWLKNIGF